MTQIVSVLGRYFVDTDVHPCDGQNIQVYNRTHEQVEADIAAYLTYAPLCIGGTYGSVIDAAGWENPDVNELFCIVLNDANKAGTYTFYLYYQGTLTFSYPVSLGIGWSAFWYAGNGEVPGNGEYQVDIRDPDGIAIATRTFTIINYPAPPPYLTVTPLSHNSPAAGETFTITVESNVSWTAVDDQTWVSLSPTSGTGNGTITATVNENTGTSSRTWHVTVAGDGESRTRTYTQAGGVAPTCEYTGHASDAKIDHDDVPSSVAEGSEVTGTVSVDCIEIGETRYRVKFVVDAGSPAYSDLFLLGYIGEQDVLFTFTMPDHDVSVVVEVERCNESGEWEPCEHADHIKTYTIALALYEGPYGVIVEGYPIPKCTGACPNGNPCVADEGDELSFKVKIKNAGNESGMIRATFEYNGLTRCEVHENLDPGETSDEKTLCVDQFWMADADIMFQIQTSHRTQLLPDVVWETDETHDFMYCYKQVVNGYSIVLNDLPDEVHTGDKITFSGTLSHNAGGAVNNKTIEIMEKDIVSDDFIVKGTTNPDGTFAISWTVKKVGGWLEGKTAEFYARFKFDSKEVISNVERVAIVGPSITKAIVYGGIAVALFAGGSIAESFAGPKGKMIGMPVKLGALIPAGLCGYQTYLIAKDKIPSG